MSKPYILYPFQFQEMPITDKALDVLGFSQYYDGSGDYGYRSLDLGDVPGARYKLICQNEKDDYNDGYGQPRQYWPSRYLCSENQNWIYFLHDLYEDIKEKRSPEELARFIEITKMVGVNMYYYIDSYINYINSGDLLTHF